MNYEELVKALRCANRYKNFTKDCDSQNPNEPCRYCHHWLCEDDRIFEDAAAAIEALLKENKELIEDHPEMVEDDGHWEWRKPNGEVLMPKRGEWIETEEKEWGIYPFKKQTCSVCDCKIDHIFMLACMDYFDDRDTVFHYCPNCGAKMEVQDENR